MDSAERIASKKGTRTCGTCHWFYPDPHTGFNGYCCWQCPAGLIVEGYLEPGYCDSSVNEDEWCSCWTKKDVEATETYDIGI